MTVHLTNGAQSDIVLLVGAGASVSLGIPAMAGMYTRFTDRTKSQITPSQKKTCTFFTRDLGVDADLEEFLLAANQIVHFQDSSLAQLIERAVVARRDNSRLHQYRERLRHLIEDAAGTRDAILEFVSRICFQFERDKAVKVLGALVSAVSKRGYLVFTTNYDPALEYAAAEQGIKVSDNFTPKGQQNIWNANIEFTLGDALTLVKLHGSVTWYADGDGQIERIDSHTSISPMGRPVKRLLIVPTRFKDIYAQHFFALYSEFLQAIANCRVLIVIGHSLRDEYIRAAIIERVRTGGVNIVIIDPTFPEMLPDEMRPARVGASGTVTHIPYKFEEFADELASLLTDMHPNEVAAKCAAIVHHRRSKTNKVKIKGKVASLQAGSNKQFKAIVDAYLLPDDRPAFVRAWLSAQYQRADGTNASEISSHFIDDGKYKLGTSLSGMIQTEVDMEIEIPSYDDWIECASKATLHIGIVREVSKTPKTAKGANLIAIDKRELAYCM